MSSQSTEFKINVGSYTDTDTALGESGGVGFDAVRGLDCIFTFDWSYAMHAGSTSGDSTGNILLEWFRNGAWATLSNVARTSETSKTRTRAITTTGFAEIDDISNLRIRTTVELDITSGYDLVGASSDLHVFNWFIEYRTPSGILMVA